MTKPQGLHNQLIAALEELPEGYDLDTSEPGVLRVRIPKHDAVAYHIGANFEEKKYVGYPDGSEVVVAFWFTHDHKIMCTDEARGASQLHGKKERAAVGLALEAFSEEIRLPDPYLRQGILSVVANSIRYAHGVEHIKLYKALDRAFTHAEHSRTYHQLQLLDEVKALLQESLSYQEYMAVMERLRGFTAGLASMVATAASGEDEGVIAELNDHLKDIQERLA